MKKKLEKAKALETMTNNMAGAVGNDQLKSTIALSPQERDHQKRTKGQTVATDKEKHGVKPTHRTTDGESLDKARGLKLVMPDSKLMNTGELAKDSKGIKTADKPSHSEQAPTESGKAPSFGAGGEAENGKISNGVAGQDESNGKIGHGVSGDDKAGRIGFSSVEGQDAKGTKPSFGVSGSDGNNQSKAPKVDMSGSDKDSAGKIPSVMASGGDSKAEKSATP